MRLITLVTLVGALASLLGTGTVRADSVLRLADAEDTHVLPASRPDFCPGTVLLQHDDGDFETGWAWGGLGYGPPDWGAWAECYNADFVCGVEFLFSADVQWLETTMDVFVWEDDGQPPPGNNPGAVLCLVAGVDPGEIATWPEISVHRVQVCCQTGGPHFVGFWGDWESIAAWYIVADTNGPEGCPRTKVPPGEWPGPGWYEPDEIFGYTTSLGIREYAGMGDCTPTPAEATTWGEIKSLFR